MRQFSNITGISKFRNSQKVQMGRFEILRTKLFTAKSLVRGYNTLAYRKGKNSQETTTSSKYALSIIQRAVTKPTN